MVADGIGGGNYGERAAQLAIDVAFSEIASANASEAGHIPKLLRLGLTRANEAVYKEAKQNSRVRGMGSTATIVAVYDNRLYLANVGDSRAYLVRSGQVVQLTQDHTWAYEMVQSGKLDKDEAYNHPKAEELIRSVGYAAKLEVDQGLFLRGDESEQEAQQNQGLPLKAGDRIVICSDGLIKNRHDILGHYVENDEMYKAVTRLSPDKAAEELLQTALDRDVDDNVSVIILEMPGSRRAFHIPKKAWYGLAGIIAIIVVVALILTVFDSEEPTALAAVTPSVTNTPLSTPTATIPPPDTGLALIIKAGAGTELRNEDGTSQVNTNDRIRIGPDVFVQTSNESTEILLSDATWLLLGPETGVELAAVLDGENNIADTQLVIQEGIVIFQTASDQSHLVRLVNEAGAEVQIQSGRGSTIVGTINDVQEGYLDVDCFNVGDCDLYSGDNFLVSLREGEWGRISGAGQLSEEGLARYNMYVDLAGIVPTLTPTPTKPPTSTPVAITPRVRTTSTPTTGQTPTISLTDTQEPQLPTNPPPPSSTATPTNSPATATPTKSAATPTRTKTPLPTATPTRATSTSQPTNTPNPTNTPLPPATIITLPTSTPITPPPTDPPPTNTRPGNPPCPNPPCQN
jgi:protein phosphatase